MSAVVREKVHNAAPLFLSLLLQKGPLPLDIGRLATGYGMGVYSYVVNLSFCPFYTPSYSYDTVLANVHVKCTPQKLTKYHLDDKVPVFIAEIAPKHLRGALTTTNQVNRYA